MNFWDKITGADMTREFKAMEQRAKKLPPDYLSAWEEIKANLFMYGDFTGRNLMPILDNALCLLEETATDGQSVADVFGGDIKGFCAALAGEKEAKTYRDKWRDELNSNIAKKLEKLEGKQ